MNFFDRIRSGWEAFRSPMVRRPDAPAKPNETDLVSDVVGDNPTIDKHPQIIGANLTPARVSSALRRAERGWMGAQCALLSEMRETTPHLQAELAKSSGAVSSCGWQVLPAQTTGRGARAEKQAERIADYVRMRLDAVDNFADKLEHLADAEYYGRSAIQTIYMRDRLGLGWAGFTDVQPHRLSYAANWRIHLFDESGNDANPALGIYPGVDIHATWPDKFVIHEPRTIGALVPTRQGTGRVLVWMAMFWKWTARDLMVFAEFFAKPWRIGFYPKNTDKASIARLKQAMLQLSGYTTAVFEAGCEPKFISPEHDKSPHLDLMRAWREEMSKVINGAVLQTQNNGSGGSRAEAEVHERAEYKVIKKKGLVLEQTVRSGLFRPLVRMQFGDEAAQLYTPIFKLNTDPPRDMKAESERVFAFVDRGGEVDADQFREQFTKLRPPAPGAKLLKPIGPKAATPAKDGDREPNSDKPAPDAGENGDDEE